MTLDPSDTATWPVVLTVDEVAVIQRFERIAPAEARRKVHNLVRAGMLTPIGGVPERMTPSLRFSRRDVLALVGES